MKLFEVGAVLLIIGSAVVGPIDAQDISFYNNGFCDDKTCAISTDAANACAQFSEPGIREGSATDWQTCISKEMATYETTAETCARAMKEIGAVATAFRYQGVARKKWVLPYFLSRTPDYTRVRCIPAPSGMK